MERDPDTVRRDGNALADAASLYLRQHGHNPVDWHPWDDRALALARELDRPVFLSIGYASCHWCHVMEAEAFADDQVATVLNRAFVPIKVDREERPDLDAAYMAAVQAMTGQGGWPMSVFLTPDLRPFHGGTYMPRDAFLALCQRIQTLWHTRRDDIRIQASRVAQAVTEDSVLADPPVIGPGDPDSLAPSIEAPALDRMARAVAEAFDRDFGGLGGRMKFPMVPLLDFLLQRFERSGDASVGHALITTLDAMAAGGIRDQVGGGFHRYATEPTWTIPHFEKMLYDNAQLARLYAEASRIVRRPDWADVAHDVIAFVLRDLTGEDGLFHASLDADSPDGEGTYYGWTPSQIAAVAGQDGPALAARLGVDAAGNFHGLSIPTLRAPKSPDVGADQDTGSDLPRRWRPALLAERMRRPPPTRDRKVVAAWNGLMIGALARTSTLLQTPAYREAAERAADRLWVLHARPSGGLWRASNDGFPTEPACLDDLAEVALGFLDLWEATFAPRHLERAMTLIEFANTHHARENGGWFMTAEDRETPLGRRLDAEDLATRGGYAGMCRALLRLGTLQGNPRAVSRADRAVRALGPSAMRHPVAMSALLAVAGDRVGPLLDIVVAGEQADPGTTALLDVARRHMPRSAVLSRVPASGPDDTLAALLPATRGKTARDGQPAAYVCRMGTCASPVTTPRDLETLLSISTAHPDGQSQCFG